MIILKPGRVSSGRTPNAVPVLYNRVHSNATHEGPYLTLYLQSTLASDAARSRSRPATARDGRARTPSI